jgi:hypothetical protein
MDRSMASFLLVPLLCLIFGCSAQRTECDEVVDEARELLTDCGINLGTYEGGPSGECTDALLTLEECFLQCYSAAPCEAFVGNDQAAHEVLNTCRGQCVDDYL